MSSGPSANVAPALRAATGAGVVTLVIGTALTVAPERFGPLGGLTERRGARIIGVADLVLVPGLLRGRPRWPWLAARAAFNVPTAAYGFRMGGRGEPRARAAALALCAITVADVTAVRRLLRARR